MPPSSSRRSRVVSNAGRHTGRAFRSGRSQAHAGARTAAAALCRVTACGGLLTVALGLAAAVEATAGQAGGVIRSVQSAAAGSSGATVTIQADGPLPEPVVGALDGPPRLYLDFKGAQLGLAESPAASGAGLRGIRVSQYRRSPLVVRVVLDLAGPTPHRIDAGDRARGTVTVVLGEPLAEPTAAAPASPSVPALPSGVNGAGPAAPAGRGGRTPAAAPPLSKEAQRYAGQVAGALGRLNALRPSVAAIAADAVSPPADLLAAAVELDGIRASLKAMRVPPSVATTHDLLMRFCALAFRAAHLRIDPGSAADPSAARNAASAAAGALIVLDRASRDLGYVPPQ